MYEPFGFQQRFFRFEEKPTDSVEALSRESGPIRLYCCRWTERTLILGNGGLKLVPRYQGDPHLLACVDRMAAVHDRFILAQREAEIHIDQDSGRIEFEKDFVFEVDD